MFRLLKNGDVYAPEHIGKADILICNDKIVDIAEHIDFDYPGTEVVDLEGRKVIPGVIDQHIHVTGGGGESGFTSKVTEVGLSDAAVSAPLWAFWVPTPSPAMWKACSPRSRPSTKKA